MRCWHTTCDEKSYGFFKDGLAEKSQLGNTDRAKWRDRWYVNDDGIRLHGNNAYGYYDWFAPEEGEEGYILAKHEGE